MMKSVIREKSKLEEDLKSLIRPKNAPSEVEDFWRFMIQMGITEANRGRVVYSSYPACNSDF